IASPLSRGGKVCSQLFEHTSTPQFLETFFNKKLNKNIHLDNISEWRRAISGNLTSAFSPFEPKLEKLPFLKRDQFVEQIYDARFKQEPSAHKALSPHEIDEIIATPAKSKWMPKQEKGVRKSCALPYELYADGQFNADKNTFEINMKAGNEVFKEDAQGSPFTVYVPKTFTGDKEQPEGFRRWSFAAKAGDTINYGWPLAAFENNQYHIRLHAPNGFYREFIGDKNDPKLGITGTYERSRFTKSLTGNIALAIINNNLSEDYTIEIIDNGYKANNQKKKVSKGENTIVIDLQKSHGWYDFTIKVSGSEHFSQRYAGRVETGKESFTDPLMG
ncbi:MAG: phospholipase domain-containing protein, partial [Ginsengibacter sp.]